MGSHALPVSLNSPVIGVDRANWHCRLSFPADGTASLAIGEIIGCLVPKPSKAAFSGATQRANAAAIAHYFADLGRESS